MKRSTIFVTGLTAGLAAPAVIPATALGYGLSIGITWVVTETAEALWKRYECHLNAPAMYHTAEVIASALRRTFRITRPTSTI